MRWVNIVSLIGGVLAALAALFGIFAVIFDWKAIYNSMGIQHVKQSMYAVQCSKGALIVPNAYPWTITFDRSDCGDGIDKMNIMAGFLSKSYICSGINNYEIQLNPKAITVYGFQKGCNSHPSKLL